MCVAVRLFCLGLVGSGVISYFLPASFAAVVSIVPVVHTCQAQTSRAASVAAFGEEYSPWPFRGGRGLVPSDFGGLD